MDYTYQDYEKNTLPVADFVKQVITRYQSSELYRTAKIADEYDRQENTSITKSVKTITKLSGQKVIDPTAASNKIPSNFLHRLNIQRATYSLGNGLNFSDEKIKEKFGKNLDTTIMDAGYDALIHGVSYLFMSDKIYEFKATEFAPLLDEYTGELRAGVRFWQLSPEKPLIAVFYEQDGYTKFAENENKNFVIWEKKHGYIQKIQKSAAFGEEVIGEINFPTLPIVPLWGSRLHQSTLVGMRGAIDAIDNAVSGFADDIKDCAEIYWIVENYGGMDDKHLREFLDRLKLNHIASANTADGGKISPYTQEIPHDAKEAFIEGVRKRIYEDFGYLDVSNISSAAKTATEINAAYQPLDENADDFENQIIKCFQKLAHVVGLDEDECVPLFKRNRISNQAEQVDMVMQSAQYLDDETVIKHLPFITVDEVDGILERKAAEEQQKFSEVTDYGQGSQMDGTADNGYGAAV